MYPDCGLAVRVGINGDPRLVQDSCSQVKEHKVFLIRHNGLNHTIYESREPSEDPQEETPEIIGEINKYLNEELPDEKETTVEKIAEKIKSLMQFVIS